MTKEGAEGASNRTFPIVGSFYRPPAKAILDSIPVDTPLILRPEPDNPVDPNAIAVWIRTSDIPKSAHKSLTLSGASCGFRIATARADSPDAFLSSILIVPSWHLGYIPAIVAKTMELLRPISGRFIIASGKPAIEIRKTRKTHELELLPPDSSDDDRRFTR